MTEKNPVDLGEWRTWDQKSKDKFLAALRTQEKPKYIWFCKVGRTCDGKPHEGVPYKHARGDQWPPADTHWVYWVLKGGRGSGKTRSGAEWTRAMSEKIDLGSIIGPTFSHVRDYMVENPKSGLLRAFDKAKISALWEPTKKRITLPHGHIIRCFSGDEPARLRGPEHGYVWLDEPAHMPLISDVWKMMNLGLRHGKRPVALCTTTPLPIPWMSDLLKNPKTRAVTVSTYANIDNLAPSFADEILSQYEGTRLGRQEIYGEVLEDVEGALWSMSMIDSHRNDGEAKSWEQLERIVVGIDPAGTSSKKRDETGIIVVGKLGAHYYVLADYSGHYTPNGWAKKAWEAYDLFDADLVVAEKNYGGEMVLSTLRNERPEGNATLVHSRRGKVLRAEPIAGLYEQGRAHHLQVLTDLEGQMTTWVPGEGDSPDRVDAMVHGMTELSGGYAPASISSPFSGLEPVGAGVRGPLSAADAKRTDLWTPQNGLPIHDPVAAAHLLRNLPVDLAKLLGPRR